MRHRYELSPATIKVLTNRTEAATPMECLSKQIQNSASVAGQIVQALQDGQIDQSEATKILEAVRQERQTLDLIETTVTYAAILPLEVRREAKVRRVL